MDKGVYATMFIDLHCPVEPRGYEITIDKKKGLTLCTPKFYNLTDKEVDSVEVRLKCFDSFGEPVGESPTNEVTYHLQDLNASGKCFFGDNTPIPLPDHPTTRTVSVTIGRVKFVDGTIWSKGDDNLIDVSTEKLSGNALEELRTLFGKDAVCYAHQTTDYWQCICGRANLLAADHCIRCKRDKNLLLINAVSSESVNNNLNRQSELRAEEESRLNEQREKEERERQEEFAKAQEFSLLRKKTLVKKIGRIGIPIAILITLIIASFLIYENIIKPSNIYKEAQALLDAGDYDNAKITFEVLGDYRDSNTMITEAMYRKAFYMLNTGDYDDATIAFRQIDDYKDSSEMVFETQYLKGLALIDMKQYMEAITTLEGIVEYSDSIEKIYNAWYLLGIESLNSGDYVDALDNLKNAGNFNNSQEMLVIAHDKQYQLALALYKQGEYLTALSQFEPIEDYNNSSEIIKECIYALAKQLMQDKEFVKAKNYLRRIKDYKDSNQLIIECTYQEALLLKEKLKPVITTEDRWNIDYEAYNSHNYTYNLFNQIRGYKDVDTIIKRDYVLHQVMGKNWRSSDGTVTMEFLRFDNTDVNNRVQFSWNAPRTFTPYQLLSRVSTIKGNKYYHDINRFFLMDIVDQNTIRINMGGRSVTLHNN